MQQTRKKKNVYASKRATNGSENEKICTPIFITSLPKLFECRKFFARSTKKYISSLAIYIS